MTRYEQAERDLIEGRTEAAVEGFEAALLETPDDLHSVRGLARTHRQLGNRDEAFPLWERLVAIHPDDVAALYELGNAFGRRADHDGALGYYRRALAVNPEHLLVHGMLLLTMLYADGADGDSLWCEQESWGNQALPSADRICGPLTNVPDPARLLRIGYLSSDFRSHPIGLSMIPVYEFHDRSAFRIYSYANQVDRDDAGTEALKSRSDEWRDVTDLNDANIAKAIAEDEIDILVVLGAHMDSNRPFVCRYRPAPIQISHHDPCTSAIPEIDYLVGDFTITPRDTAERFSERVLRLPCWTVYPIPAEARPIGPLPAKSTGRMTFGSFNNPIKITSQVIELWSEILSAVPDSRLVLKHLYSYGEQAVGERILREFSACGIEAERVEILQGVDLRSEHLAMYDRVDIALDCYPINGATTTFEALFMGVPVVTLLGQRLGGRFAASLLKSVGFEVCVAPDPSSYVLRAVELASDLDRLAQLRAMLPELVRSSRLFDARRYTRNLERYYRAVWRRWCVGSGP